MQNKKVLIKLLDFVFFDTILHHIINKYYKCCSIKIVFPKPLADPGGGAHPAPPPLTAADLWFFYAQNANFSHFFRRSLRSRLLLSTILIEI